MKLEQALMVGLTAMMTGCGGVTSRVKDGKIQNVLDQAPYHMSYIESIGIGASDPTLPSETQRKALARDAAIVKAQYEMLSMAKGVELEGGVTVDRALETDSSLETRLKETIRGAEILKSEFTTDNGCVITLRLPKHRLEKSIGVRFR